MSSTTGIEDEYSPEEQSLPDSEEGSPELTCRLGCVDASCCMI